MSSLLVSEARLAERRRSYHERIRIFATARPVAAMPAADGRGMERRRPGATASHGLRRGSGWSIPPSRRLAGRDEHVVVHLRDRAWLRVAAAVAARAHAPSLAALSGDHHRGPRAARLQLLVALDPGARPFLRPRRMRAVQVCRGGLERHDRLPGASSRPHAWHTSRSDTCSRCGGASSWPPRNGEW